MSVKQYFCETCNKNININYKFKHFKTKSHIKKQGGDVSKGLRTGSDLQTMSSKLPDFPWSKYKGEHHIPKYNYAGRLGLSVF